MATEKETTAPIPSVAPDGEQPSALARTDSITDIEETHKQFGKIQRRRELIGVQHRGKIFVVVVHV